ncbi:hypothetical protein ASPZODRAFT_160242 [Penicilliopsis zonata CBS 506.65]|uniref:Uncharacterized protein n=1 Tax=Penicilliopsis zonata CBS 506.65 TaxID=1073090 RepID=A0A1L9SDZ4_9EURO|nr:hypothetical protein ASPZODRAFT_160242 [Penicilliopsis zonata CBS 506.65]OJJ45368.1 hypothetical protein ASPZODRAFT_160242 [Penicilliopsis zonata CBS 506.65]
MQGFNMGRYVPPDQEGLTTGNKLAGKHPLGARARHLHTTGALVVRFEMPFAIWCTTCKPHETIIGQGVRFNAEKKKVGNYYSTPIYSFRMKHTACGGWIEIRTDPQNTAYVVVEGARKRETGDDKAELAPGEIRIKLPGEETVESLAADPFAKLEGKVEDKRQAETATTRILELQRRQQRDWDDPYEQSRRLRRTFRAERKTLEKAAANREALQDKMSLGIELVDETEEDRLRAGMVDFGTTPEDSTRAALRVRPMFFAPPSSSSSPSPSNSSKDEKLKKLKRLKSEGPTDRKAALRSELAGNTRAAVDPFLATHETAWKPETKRRKTMTPLKQTPTGDGDEQETPVEPPPKLRSAALVGYCSDSD